MLTIERLDEVLQMPAGQELDILVSTIVMGWTDVHLLKDGYSAVAEEGFRVWGPQWSKGPGLTEEILNRLRALTFYVSIMMPPHGSQYLVGVDWGMYIPDYFEHHGRGDTLSLALCRAAVAARLTQQSYTNDGFVPSEQIVTYWGNKEWQDEVDRLEVEWRQQIRSSAAVATP